VAAVCSHCVEDDDLKKLIRDDGEPGECDLCQKNRKKTFSADKLAEILDPIIREHFAPDPEVKHFGEDDSEWYEQEGDPLSFHVQEIIGHDLGFEDEVVEALVDNEDCDERDGDIPFFDSSQDYVSTPVFPHSYYENWNYVLEGRPGHAKVAPQALSIQCNLKSRKCRVQVGQQQRQAKVRRTWGSRLPQGTPLHVVTLSHAVHDYTEPIVAP
jgi:hypothetical protein